MTELPDIELVAAKVHEAWMRGKQAQGVTSRKSESGEEQMRPYAELSEAVKELDRASVRAVYAAIAELTDVVAGAIEITRLQHQINRLQALLSEVIEAHTDPALYERFRARLSATDELRNAQVVRTRIIGP